MVENTVWSQTYIRVEAQRQDSQEGGDCDPVEGIYKALQDTPYDRFCVDMTVVGGCDQW